VVSTKDLRFDTAQLASLRMALAKLASKNLRLGEIVQFHIVVDANRIRYPDRGPTSLEQMIRATILIAYAPRWLDAEMVSAIPQAAASCKVSSSCFGSNGPSSALSSSGTRHSVSQDRQRAGAAI
jgi:hypothetical protein